MSGDLKIERDASGFACAISRDGQWLIHLNSGTEFNEKNIEPLVAEFNSLHAELERARTVIRDIYNVHELLDDSPRRCTKPGKPGWPRQRREA